jgi:membrane protein implicated in regulation of membrane protease activity
VDLAKAEFGEISKIRGAIAFIGAAAIFLIPTLVMALFALSAALISAGWSQSTSYLTAAIVAAAIAGVMLTGSTPATSRRVKPSGSWKRTRIP